MIPWNAADGATVHEVELGVILNDVSREDASHWTDRIGGYCLLLDMGDFDLIKAAITSGGSWSTSKMQDNFLILGDLLDKSQIKDPHNCELLLTINGETKQADNTGNMLFKID
jgi:acylpyruvate hydrolase